MTNILLRVSPDGEVLGYTSESGARQDGRPTGISLGPGEYLVSDIPDNVYDYWYDVATQSFVPKGTSSGGVFDFKTKSWLALGLTEDVRSQRRDYINAERLKANQGSFTYAGKQISTDALARSDIDAVNGLVSLLGAMPPGWVGGWKALDNTYVSIPDVDSWKAFYGAMVSQGLSNFAHSQTLKAQIDAATTVEEVNAIVW